ncbi:phosphatase PAP2 family protein [Geomesophilobacter sediminis]|uniref:Phosphatase PAP2 family protein n=1 Tax=Geomesophilobacter sediminis TaxID=2798584 RepID=A0A8J7JKV5_9BACT|nr:phosphatase PAP2 family protein [Geomesophilobacter sediminis]MBJ6724220.1 phosphatase PAP2 family protein [Geomesophilobacter sediminis]
MTDLSRTSQKWIASFFLVAVLTALCARFIDLPVALWVKETFIRNPAWAVTTGRMPDLLLHLVLLVSVGACCLRLVRLRKGHVDNLNDFLLLASWDAPASFVAKALLKPLFGRLNNRLWLKNPDLYGFYWFQNRWGYDAFPSGHMLVLVALLALLVRFFPVARIPALLLALVTSVALILTGYHFLSDIVAGCYLGIVVEALVHAAICGRKAPSAA